jgi:plasmid stabilization system protein ParE
VHGNYLIPYRASEERVDILLFVHGARDYYSLLDIASDAD